MKKREIAKQNATELIAANLDRYNELMHDHSIHMWLQCNPDGTIDECQEADMNTRHYISYPDKPLANILDIITCGGQCDCDACVSWRDAHSGDMTDEEFETKWGYDRFEAYGLDYSFAQHLKDYDAYIDPTDDALSAIDGIEYGYFDDEN